jgi:hypothetical protein
VIREIEGRKINDLVAAIVRICSFAPGDTVKIIVDLPSNGGKATYSVVLGKADSI